jgi:hypothetical protein
MITHGNVGVVVVGDDDGDVCDVGRAKTPHNRCLCSLMKENDSSPLPSTYATDDDDDDDDDDGAVVDDGTPIAATASDDAIFTHH